MNSVVIVESPAKCKTINKYLGKDFKVLASFGHIRDLPSKDGSVLPDKDFEMLYEISSSSQKHVKEIADAVKKADRLILATDPDREGEAISWHVLEALKQKKALREDLKIERISFDSITKKAVNEALESPREVDMDLVNAQQARRALDYLVGFNLSPVLWRKLPGSKSAGRVQSVALRVICEREDEIEKFISQEYWTIKGDFKTPAGDEFEANLSQVDGKKLDKFAIVDEKSAKEIENTLKDKKYSVKNVEKKESKRRPYAPFTTSTLQQEAARKLGFSATRTMQTAQKLYEGMDIGGETAGLITYMRTDGVTVAQEAINATRDLISQKYGNEYLPEKQNFYKAKAKNAQEAHEAIRPTDPKRTPDKVKSFLNDDQFKLYELIWKRLIASQTKDVILDQVAADIESDDGKYTFRANGSTVKFDGFYRIYREGRDDDEDEKDENKLPPLNEGDDQELKKAESEQHFTQPPPRFTEASLVKKLEEMGIGRPSTYASIISVLQDREYVKLETKRFFPEARGRLVTAFLVGFFPKYVEYDFTAELEEELDQISAGELDWKTALSQFWQGFSSSVDGAMKLEFTEVISTLNELLEPLLFPGEGELEEKRTCPTCGEGKLSLKLSKFGAFVGCSNYPDCNYTRQVSNGEGGEEGSNGDGPTLLGIDENTGMEITLRKGPYGHYVQLGGEVDGEKPKRASLPKGKKPEDIDLEAAQGLLALPREVGAHPETGKMIKANIGRYGPYIEHDRKFVSLKGDDDVLTIGINRAVDLIAAAGDKKGAEPLKVLGAHPETGEDIGVYDGRYGPYVKHQRVNASLPKGTGVEEVTLEEAVELIKKQAAKKKTKRKKK